MALKLLLTWNSHPSHQRERFHHVSEFVHKVSPLGLELLDAWYTVYGEAPEILLGFVPRNGKQEGLETIIASDQWKSTVSELGQYITDYEQRIVKATSGFQF